VLSDDVDNISQTLSLCPRESLRELCNQSRVSHRSVQKAAKLLKLHLYVHVTYELEGPGTEQ